MMQGGFSRFGLWRQIALGVGLVIAVQFLSNGVARIAMADEAAWPLVYLPHSAGIALAFLLLTLAARPRRLRRAGPPGAAAA